MLDYCNLLMTISKAAGEEACFKNADVSRLFGKTKGSQNHKKMCL